MMIMQEALDDLTNHLNEMERDMSPWQPVSDVLLENLQQQIDLTQVCCYIRKCDTQSLKWYLVTRQQLPRTSLLQISKKCCTVEMVQLNGRKCESSIWHYLHSFKLDEWLHFFLHELMFCWDLLSQSHQYFFVPGQVWAHAAHFLYWWYCIALYCTYPFI